ncbi:MAG: S66 peptidase family protein [Longimicrobiales bacterium]
MPKMTAQTPIRPRAIEKGARVALVAPGGPVSSERVQLSIERCRTLDLEPVVYAGAHQRTGYLAGPDRQRLADLQDALNDDSIAAVWALRGGYGTTRILRQLDLTRARTRPKPFIGFSDNTAVHALFAKHGLVSFHGPHPGAAFPPETEAAFRRVLFQRHPAGELPVRAVDPQPRTLRAGQVEAPLVGGNLALLAALCGTFAAVQARDHILFLEDTGEAPYRLDRLLVQLKEAGVLTGVLGLALGRFNASSYESQDEVYALMQEVADWVDVPAVLDLPIGHVDHNWTLPVGVRASLDADGGRLIIMEAAVTE